MFAGWIERTACRFLIEPTPQVPSLAWLFWSKHSPPTSLHVNRLILFPLLTRFCRHACLRQTRSHQICFRSTYCAAQLQLQYNTSFAHYKDCFSRLTDDWISIRHQLQRSQTVKLMSLCSPLSISRGPQSDFTVTAGNLTVTPSGQTLISQPADDFISATHFHHLVAVQRYSPHFWSQYSQICLMTAKTHL